MDEEIQELIKTNLKFTRKPAKLGSRYVFTIPQQYITNNLIDVDEEYTLYLAKSKKKKEKS